VPQIPKDLFSSARTLSIHMYALSSEGLFTNQAYATAVILLVVVLTINTMSSRLANRLLKGNNNG
jgi:phosphate transport system permease protein